MRFILLLARRNLRSDWFATLCAIVGVALGTATVNVVLTLDVNTRSTESGSWSTNPDLEIDLGHTVALLGLRADGRSTLHKDAKEETHEDYQVMRSAIRLGSLSAFLVGALIVFFTFRVVVEQKKRDIALLRSLGAQPRQIAGVFLAEAIIVGTLGASIGLVATLPLSVFAAIAGITTTGRSELTWLWIPWKLIAVVSAIGGGTAILGIAKPLYDVLRLDVARTLRPGFIDSAEGMVRRSGVAVLALPFMALMYVLIRPFFVEVLPSLAFFIFEAGLVCAGFLSMLVLVPQVVSALGRLVGRMLSSFPTAPRLLTVRRIERAGHEFSWAVSGVMLVFALLLSLHIVTRSLKDEVAAWAGPTVRDNAYLITRHWRSQVPPDLVGRVPPSVIRVRYSGRTPRPNQLLAVDTAALKRFAESMNQPGADALVALGPGRVVLSRLMARRHDVDVGDQLVVRTQTRTATLAIVGVTDLGYLPMIGPYRDSKTYALIAEDDFDLIAPYAHPMGAGYALRDPDFAGGLDDAFGPWPDMFGESAFKRRGVRVEIGSLFELDRIDETDQDFVIFDLILFLTAILAGVGIANNLVLSAHVRRREIALYRVLGMPSGQVRRLFVLEGSLIGLLGGLLAVVLGIPLGFAAIGALEIVSAFEVHFVLPPLYAVNTIVGAVLISLFSALYPAFTATRLSSAESVHYE